MSERNSAAQQFSPQTLARVGGVLYLLIIAIGIVGEAYIRGTLIVPGDATATAQRILESEFLWRLGVAGQFVLLLCAVALTWIFYVLLRPVNRDLALLAVFFGLTSLAVESVSGLYLGETLLPLSDVESLSGADPQHLHALAYLSVSAHADAFGMALIFFGVECVIVGLAGALFPWILLPSLVAELSFAVWLLTKGVNVAAWRQKVGATG